MIFMEKIQINTQETSAYVKKEVEMPLRKLANLQYPKLPALTDPNFEGLSPPFLSYENDSNLT